MSTDLHSYKNFEVRFQSWSQDDNTYQVRVETVEGREVTVPFFLPSFVSASNGSRQTATRRGELSMSHKMEGNIGEELYSMLFQGKVLKFLGAAQAIALREGCGLRVRLCADLMTPGMALVANLPWERLNDGDDDLCLSDSTPIVRYLDSGSPLPPVVLSDRLRILVAMANPEVPGLARLDLEEEFKRVAGRFEGSDLVEVEKLAPANSMALRKRLRDRDRPVHVLHFIGHGLFQNEQGQLVFEKEDGSPEYINGNKLVRFVLRDARSLRLVFLNSCNTAIHSSSRSSDVFAGVASSIIKTGMPAVVAMQEPIKDEAAIAFADTFYTMLAEGNSIERSLTEGRIEIGMLSEEDYEWAIPVLFLRSPDGVLFPSLQQEAPQAPDPEPQPRNPELETPNPNPQTVTTMLVYLMCDEADLDAIGPLYQYLSMQGVDIEIPAFDGSAREIAEANKKILERCDLILHYYGAGSAAWKRIMAEKAKAVSGLEGREKAPPKVYTYIAPEITSDKNILLRKKDAAHINATEVDPSALHDADDQVLKAAYKGILNDFLKDIERYRGL